MSKVVGLRCCAAQNNHGAAAAPPYQSKWNTDCGCETGGFQSKSNAVATTVNNLFDHSGSAMRQVLVGSPEFLKASRKAELEYCCTLPSARPTLPWLLWMADVQLTGLPGTRLSIPFCGWAGPVIFRSPSSSHCGNSSCASRPMK